MSRPVNPCSLRNVSSHSAFLDRKTYSTYLPVINCVTEFFRRKYDTMYYIANVSVRVCSDGRLKVSLLSARVNALIGPKGENIMRLQETLQKEVKKVTYANGLSVELKVELTVREEKNPYQHPYIICCIVEEKMKNHIPYNKALMFVMERMRASGIFNYRIKVSGRLNGAEIAASKKHEEGSVPSNQISCGMMYAYKAIQTPSGTLSIKVCLVK